MATSQATVNDDVSKDPVNKPSNVNPVESRNEARESKSKVTTSKASLDSRSKAALDSIQPPPKIDNSRMSKGSAILGATHAAMEASQGRRMSRKIGAPIDDMKKRLSIAPAPEVGLVEPSTAVKESNSKTRQITGGERGGGKEKNTRDLRGSNVEDTDHSEAILGATRLAMEGRRSRRNSRAANRRLTIEGDKTAGRLSFTGLDRLFNGESTAEVETATGQPTMMVIGPEDLKRLREKWDPGSVPAKAVWKPRGCQVEFTTTYPLPPAAKREYEVIHETTKKEKAVDFERVKLPWCGCCMRESFDPYELPCGHSFCRRCIFDTNFFLLKDYADTIKDTRAVMRCPLKCCKAVISCLSLINGDFRFKHVRPEHKFRIEEDQLNLCEQHRLTTYKVRIDVDVTKRKSDDLFHGLDDVVIIP